MAKPPLEAKVSVAQEMPSHTLRIRIFSEADRSEVLRIYSDVGFGKDVLAEIELARSAGGEIFVAEVGGEAVGVSSCLALQGTGWIGGVAVAPHRSRQGIGSELTEAAIRWLRDRRVRILQLLATEKARGLYERLGFTAETEYAVLRVPDDFHLQTDPTAIRPATQADARAILDLDRTASGEDRSRLLLRVWPRDCWVVDSDGEIQGFHARSRWEIGGATVANNTRAGLALLCRALRVQPNIRYTSIPRANPGALNLLRAQGFEEVNQATRMRLGPPLSWIPSNIFGVFNLYWG